MTLQMKSKTTTATIFVLKVRGRWSWGTSVMMVRVQHREQSSTMGSSSAFCDDTLVQPFGQVEEHRVAHGAS